MNVIYNLNSLPPLSAGTKDTVYSKLVTFAANKL